MIFVSNIFAVETGLILAVLLFCLDQEYALENKLILKSDCICPGYTVTFAECTVVGRSVGTTVWRGSAFDCPSDELNLLHDRFGTNDVQVCNNGSISGRGLWVEEGCYTSELTITVSSDMVGKSVQCIHYDVNSEILVGTLTINFTTGLLLEPNTIYINIRSADIASKKLTFDWTSNTTNCSIFDTRYNILASNCGSCPTMTNHTTATCTSVPTDGRICTFRVQTVICGSMASESAIHVMLKEYCNRGESDCTGATVSASLFSILSAVAITCTLVVVVSIIRNKTVNNTTKQGSSDGENLQHQDIMSSTINTRKNPAYSQVTIS